MKNNLFIRIKKKGDDGYLRYKSDLSVFEAGKIIELLERLKPMRLRK